MFQKVLVLVLCLALTPTLSWAAFAEVGSGTQRVSATAADFDSTTIIYPGNVTSGNLLICTGIVWQSTPWSSITITDTRTSTWTVLGGTSISSYKTFIAYAKAPSTGANTVTIDPNGVGNWWSGSCDEFSGNEATNLLDVDGGSSTGSGTTPSDSITTANANALIIGVFTQSSGGTHALTAGGSYTTFGETESAANAPHHAEFRIATSAQAYTVDGTVVVSVDWQMQTASFQELASGTPINYFMRRINP